jgi:hypothetical protein
MSTSTIIYYEFFIILTILKFSYFSFRSQTFRRTDGYLIGYRNKPLSILIFIISWNHYMIVYQILIKQIFILINWWSKFISVDWSRLMRRKTQRILKSFIFIIFIIISCKCLIARILDFQIKICILLQKTFLFLIRIW